MSIFCSIAFVACQNKNSEIEETIEEAMKENEVELLGADVDEHGCKASAGYTWSQVREDCIRVFEEGTTLLPVEVEESEAVFAAFILYSEDKETMELFLPTSKESILLQKTENSIYEEKGYKFHEEEKALYIDGTLEYKLDQE